MKSARKRKTSDKNNKNTNNHPKLSLVCEVIHTVAVSQIVCDYDGSPGPGLLILYSRQAIAFSLDRKDKYFYEMCGYEKYVICSSQLWQVKMEQCPGKFLFREKYPPKEFVFYKFPTETGKWTLAGHGGISS